MKRNKFLALLKSMLSKMLTNPWPLWWAVLPFLFFYAWQMAKHSMLIKIIF